MKVFATGLPAALVRITAAAWLLYPLTELPANCYPKDAVTVAANGCLWSVGLALAELAACGYLARVRKALCGPSSRPRRKDFRSWSSKVAGTDLPNNNACQSLQGVTIRRRGRLLILGGTIRSRPSTYDDRRFLSKDQILLLLPWDFDGQILCQRSDR